MRWRDAGRTGLPAARRGRRDRHEPRPLRLRPAPRRGPGSSSISASPSPGQTLPGVDLIFPDIAFLEEERDNLAGIVITHAHEDHFGALIDLWPRLRVPVYATPSRPACWRPSSPASRAREPIPVDAGQAGRALQARAVRGRVHQRRPLHPESNALAIRTPLGTVLHSGDWKLDDDADPRRCRPTRRASASIGEEGVLALICDSTNAHARGRAARARRRSRRELAASSRSARPGRLHDLRLQCRRASARSPWPRAAPAARSSSSAAPCAGSSTSPTELGYLEGLPPFLDEDAYRHLPRDKVVALLHRQPGRAARGARPGRRRTSTATSPSSPGDIVVFSSRAIPGNELAINRIINALTARGVRVITDRDRLVHVSGHPRRDELRRAVWLDQTADRHSRPWRAACISPPMPRFARDLGVAEVVEIAERRHGPPRARRRPRRSTRSRRAASTRTATLIGGIDGDRRHRAAAARLRGPCRRVASCSTIAARSLGRSRVALTGLPIADATGGRSRTSCAMRSTAPRIDPAAAAARPGGRPRGGPPRGPRRGRRCLGQEAGLHGLRRGRMNGAMIGRLNHVAIAVPDLAAACALYRDSLGADGLGAVPQPEHGVTVGVHRPSQHQVELIAPLGEPRRSPPSSSATRPAASIISATRSTMSQRRPATWPRPAPASSATATRSARTASRWSSFTRRISSARSSSWSRREP